MSIELLNILGISLTAIVNILLSILVLTHNPRSQINRVFFLASLSIGIWVFCLLFYEFPIIFSSLFWIKMTYVAVSFATVFILVFSFIFPVSVYKRAWVFAFITSIAYIATTVWLLFFTNTWIEGVTKTAERGLQTHLGQSYIIWCLMIWAVFSWSLINFISNSRRLQGLQKMQLLYLFWGFGLWGVFVTIPDIIFPIFFNETRYFFVSAVTSVFFTLAVGYTILKHRFLDIRIAFQETILRIMTALLVTLFMYSGAVIYYLLAGIGIRYEIFFLILVISFVLTLIYGKIVSLARVIGSKFFFQSVYDYKQVVGDLSKSFSTIINMENLADVIIDALGKALKVNRIGVLVWDPIEKRYTIEKSIGFNEHNGISNLHQEGFLATYLEKHPQVIVREEIKKIADEAINENEKKILTDLSVKIEHIEASLIMPVVNVGKLIGLIVLGDKKSGDPFTVQDVNMLTTISSQAGIAFENAALYGQLSDLNQNLLKKVDERTADLQKANEDLKSLDKMKDQLVATTSHELKTPLSNAQNYLWYVLNSPAKGTKLASGDTEKLNRSLMSIQDLVKLINNILNVSKLEAGKLTVDLKKVEFEKLEKIMKKILSEFELKFKAKNLKVSYSPTKGTLPAVSVDLMRFEEVFTNLVSNAVKYTDQGGITISVKKENKTLVFAVSDTGKGIGKEYLSRMFEKFSREDVSLSSSNLQTGGTGLGLYIAKSLVKLMGGEISVESELGKGTTFYFTLLIL